MNAFVICALGDMHAVEAEPAIRRAFEEDRVDTQIVAMDWMLGELGLGVTTVETSRKRGIRLFLVCTACRHTRPHHVRRVFYDVGTAERRERGEETPYPPHFIPQRIHCPKCGAVDQYELGGMAQFALMGELVQAMAKAEGHPSPPPDGFDEDADAESPLVISRFTTANGRAQHPLESRDWYRAQVAAAPDRADLRVRYANVLGRLGYLVEGRAEYQAALKSDPSNLEAHFNLGGMAHDAGDDEEARRSFERLLAVAPRNARPDDDAADCMRAAREALAGNHVAVRGLDPTFSATTWPIRRTAARSVQSARIR